MDLTAGTEPPSRLDTERLRHHNVPAHRRRAARTGSHCPRCIHPRPKQTPPSAPVPVSAESRAAGAARRRACHSERLCFETPGTHIHMGCEFETSKESPSEHLEQRGALLCAGS